MSEEDGGISQFSHLSYIERMERWNGLLSNQILQRTNQWIGDIIECNCSIWNTDGVMLAAVGKEKPAVKKKAVCSFLKELEVTRRSGGAPGWMLWSVPGLWWWWTDLYFRDRAQYEIDVHTSGRLSVCQLESLLRSGSERLDRNRFIQNLLLDNLLLVDIYNQAKKAWYYSGAAQSRLSDRTEESGWHDRPGYDPWDYSSGTSDFVLP